MTRVAAIDCGTNSIRLLVADLNQRANGSFEMQDLHREVRRVRLGQTVDANGVLTSAALQRTAIALTDYAATIGAKGVEAVRMVATSAVRDAENQDEFFTMVQKIIGVHAEVISGQQEALLSFAGSVHGREPDTDPLLVVDVGGGSTELVLGDWDGATATIHASCSVDIGSVRLTERALPSDPATPAEVDEAREMARLLLMPAFDAVAVSGVTTCVAVAGTVLTLSAVFQSLTGQDPISPHLSRLSHSAIDRTVAELLSTDLATRAANPMIPSGREDIIIGGGIVVQMFMKELMQRGGPSEIAVSEHDILDGIALSLTSTCTMQS